MSLQIEAFTIADLYWRIIIRVAPTAHRKEAKGFFAHFDTISLYDCRIREAYKAFQPTASDSLQRK